MGLLTWERPDPGPDEPTSRYSHWWLASLHDAEYRRAVSYLRMTCTPDAGLAVWAEQIDVDAHDKGQRVPLRRARAARAASEMDVRLAATGRLLGLDDWLIATRLPENVVNLEADSVPRWSEGDVLLPPDGTVFAAVIDDGIGFANENFRDPPGADGLPRTRFDYVWLQGAPADRTQHLPFGREFDRTAIDDLLEAHSAGGTVDEIGLYRSAGLIDFGREEVQSAGARASHGTGVLDRLAGRRAGRPVEDNDPVLIGISLPTQITQDTTGTFLEPVVIMAIKRIMERVGWLRQVAEKRGTPRSYPVLINLSYALTAGPMDGTTPVDRFVAAVHAVQKDAGQNFAFVVPAGNHRQAQTHAQLALERAAPRGVTWRLLPDDRTPSFVEIWTRGSKEKPGAPTVRCNLLPPGSEDAPAALPEVQFGQYVDLRRDGRRLARAYYDWYPTSSEGEPERGRERIIVAVPPTVADTPDQEFIPSGDWRLSLSLDAPGPCEVDLHVQRDDTPVGYRLRGRQSHFVDPSYEEYTDAGRSIEDDDGQGDRDPQGHLERVRDRRADPDRRGVSAGRQNPLGSLFGTGARQASPQAARLRRGRRQRPAPRRAGVRHAERQRGLAIGHQLRGPRPCPRAGRRRSGRLGRSGSVAG